MAKWDLSKLKMREGLKGDIESLLECYLADLTYWVEAYDYDTINSITAGTPEFATLEDARAWRVRVKAVLKEFRDAL